MPQPQTFQDLLGRVRAGDAQAADELVRQYEASIRRIVRIRLQGSRLRRILDSMDICQSVMLSFFTRAAQGQYRLDTPEQLLKLLAAMARHKVADQAEREQAQCRDYRRAVSLAGNTADRAATGSDPASLVAAQEAVAEARRRLTPEERRLLEMRDQGLEWGAIAQVVGGKPDALRKRLDRAVERVARELGL